MGDRLDMVFEEEDAFWEFAVVEVLRHTGIRIFAAMTRRIWAAVGSTGTALPALVAYDYTECVNSEPLPFLFQRTAGRVSRHHPAHAQDLRRSGAQ